METFPEKMAGVQTVASLYSGKNRNVIAETFANTKRWEKKTVKAAVKDDKRWSR
jgi:hypothetical protein